MVPIALPRVATDPLRPQRAEVVLRYSGTQVLGIHPVIARPRVPVASICSIPWVTSSGRRLPQIGVLRSARRDPLSDSHVGGGGSRRLLHRPDALPLPLPRRDVRRERLAVVLCGAPLPHLHRDWAHPCHICTRTRSPLPHLHRDWAHPCHICAGTGLTPATSVPGLGSPLPHPSWDWARLCHIWTGNGLTLPNQHWLVCFRRTRRCMRACCATRRPPPPPPPPTPPGLWHAHTTG